MIRQHLEDQRPAPSEAPPAAEPTLGVVLRSLGSRRPPRQLLEGVWVALPWAAYFASLGWWRASMGATALGAFGLWAVGDRWARTTASGWRRAAARAFRATAAAVCAGLTAALVLEMFLRLLGAGPIS